MNRVYWLCFLLIFLGNRELAAQQDAAHGKQLILQAYEITQNAGEEDTGAFDKVLALCQQGISTPVDAKTKDYAKKLMSWARNRRGEVLAKQDKDKEAYEEFDAAVQLDATRWRAWHNRGVSRAIAGEYEKALEDFTKTIELEKEYANAWFNRAEVLYEQGKFKEALADYNEAIRINPQDPEFQSSRGHTLFRMGRIREAIADYDNVLRLDPKYVDALVLRAAARFQLGEYEGAANDYRVAVKLQPNHLQGLINLAWMMATCPDERFLQPDLAVQAAEKARKLAGEKADYRLADVLAASLASKGSYSQAAKVLETALEEFPAELKPAADQRLAMYKSGKPYREPRAPRAVKKQ